MLVLVVDNECESLLWGTKAVELSPDCGRGRFVAIVSAVEVDVVNAVDVDGFVNAVDVLELELDPSFRVKSP